MAEESQIFANQQNEQKSAKWRSRYDKMRQIRGGKLTLFMQNKANFIKAGINVNCYLQKDYENEPNLCRSGKQSQTKPIWNRKTEDGRQSLANRAGMVNSAKADMRHSVINSLTNESYEPALTKLPPKDKLKSCKEE